MEPQEHVWQVYMDGTSNCRGAGVGIILISLEGIRVEKSFRLGFPASNNEVEYEALLVGLRMSRQIGANMIQLHCDSWLVVSQVMGEFEAKDHRMISYLKEVGVLRHQFKRVKFSHISSGSNSHADSLATLASSMADPFLRIVFVELLPFSSLTPSNGGLVLSIHPSASWMDPIVAYPRDGILLEDKKASKQIRRSSPRYWVSKKGKLYKRSYS